MTEDAQNDPIQLLQRLIRCPSVTPTDAGVLEVVQAALEPLGFVVTRLRCEGDDSYPVDNLWATRRRGNSGGHLLFAGHTDVVPPGDAVAWKHDPFGGEIADGAIYGRGATDMKGGIAAFIGAVAEAVADGSADRGTISLVITNDEEADAVNGTVKLMAWAAERGDRFDFAIVGEPSATATVGDSIKIGRRGSFNGRIAVTGVQGHVAYPERARNPVPVAAALVTALNGPLDRGTAHFPPSNLEVTSIDVGNETTNVIPARAIVRFNVRYNDSFAPETLEAHIREILATIDHRGCDVSFTLPKPSSRSFLSPLGGGVETLSRTIERLTGRLPELSTGGGTSDARFIAQYCPVVECGLPGGSMHKVDEYASVADVLALTKLYGAFIADFFT